MITMREGKTGLFLTDCERDFPGIPSKTVATLTPAPAHVLSFNESFHILHDEEQVIRIARARLEVEVLVKPLCRVVFCMHQ